MAEDANKKGNGLYLEGKHTEAIKWYKKASSLDLKEPKYPSNLSAALFEVGRYTDAIESVRDAWTRLQAPSSTNSSTNSTGNATDASAPTPNPPNPLAIKLSTRLAKAKLNAVCSGALSLHSRAYTADASEQERAEARVDEEVEKFGVLYVNPVNGVGGGGREGKSESVNGDREEEDPKVTEMKAVWAQWRCVRSQCAIHLEQDCVARKLTAQKRFRALRIFKSTSDPTIEYFTFGTDCARSLFNAPADEGTLKDLNLDSPLRYFHKKNWAFLFGGSGDARHVFSTLSHMDWLVRHNTTVQSLHMTLVDIHPASLARVIVILSLLQQIADLDRRKSLKEAEDKEMELYATVFFIYTSMIMPEYCCNIVIETAKALVTQLSQPTHPLAHCLHIDDQSLSAIISVLTYWSTPLPKSTLKYLEVLNHVDTPMDFEDDHKAEQKYKQRLRSGEKVPKSAFEDFHGERTVFRRAKVLLPPKKHAGRFPVLMRVAEKYAGATDGMYRELREEIGRMWKPNPTLFDRTSTEWYMPQIFPQRTKGYPAYMTTFFDYSGCEYFAMTANSLGDKSAVPAYCSKANGFGSMTPFFAMVSGAMARLKKVLKIEMVVGDLIGGVPRLLAGDVSPPRPSSFPQKYTRMWLSNVPDYTHGLLSAAVHLVPHLEDNQISMSNVLSQMGWESLTQFCYTYTLLRPEDLPRFLGCKLLDYKTSTVHHDTCIQQMPLPRPLGELASKKELHDWLSRLLLCILCNPKSRPPPNRVDMPSNLAAFFHVLAHLARVGFPPHWIGDFAQCLISDNLVTDSKIYLGSSPIPVDFYRQNTASRKVHLRAWQANLEVIVASTYSGLPFSISLPPTFPAYSDFEVYQANVLAVDLRKHSSLLVQMTSFVPAPDIVAPFTSTVGLIFYKPSRTVDGSDVAKSISDVLEGSGSMKGANVQILLSQERSDIYNGTVSWKMSRQWYEKMVQERWEMIAYRTDLQCPVTKEVAAVQWQKCS